MEELPSPDVKRCPLRGIAGAKESGVLDGCKQGTRV